MHGEMSRGENLVYGGRDGVGAFDYWLESKGHHENLLNPSYSQIGTGEYKRFYTQLFR
jgi:uncharacterized protein YkwD